MNEARFEPQSLLRLFEAGYHIAGCLELDRLILLSLNILSLQLKAPQGFVLYEEIETGHERLIPLYPNKDWNAEAAVKRFCEKANVAHLLDLPQMLFLEVANQGFQEVLLLPATKKESIRIVFGLLYGPPSRQERSMALLEPRARIMARQISIALGNSVRLSHARGEAFTDDLTGLYNSRYLSFILERELKRSQRFHANLSILFIDLDFFKNINDKYGHLVGSKMLIEVSKVIRTCLREIDTAVRYGGDEFTVILVNTDSGGATKVAERIRSSMESHIFLTDEGKNLRITACIGIASHPEHARSVTEFLDMSDQAMYRGKNTTRNVVYIFNPMQPRFE